MTAASLRGLESSACAAANSARWADAARLFLKVGAAAANARARARAHVSHAQMQLAQGKATRATWAALEQRFVAEPWARAGFPRAAQWDGKPVSELFIWHEGPFENVVQLGRYVQAVASHLVSGITWEVPDELEDFAGAYLVNDDVRVVRRDAPVKRKFPKGTAHCSIVSLPAIFAAWGWPDPDVPPVSRPERRRVPLRVGTCGVSMGALEALIPRVHLVDLRGQEFDRNFVSQTVQLFDEVDLVIAEPGLVLHMAGALGVPAFTFEPWGPSWLWAEAGPAVKGPLRYDSVRVFHTKDASAIVQAVAELVR